MSQCDFGAIVPLNCFRGPIIFVIVNICPFSFLSVAVRLDARRHMDTVLLFQFLVCQVLARRRLGSCIGYS